MNTVLLYALAWLGMVMLAIFNGILRQSGYGPSMSELSAHQLSTLIAVVLFGVYIRVLTGFRCPKSGRQAIGLGCMWLGMTVAFEFLFGHYVAGHPWSRLFHDYNLAAGRVWSLLLVWTTLAPYLFYRIRSGV